MAKAISRFTLVFLLTPWSAGAQLVVSEIMYDIEGSDSGREWIEVHHTGGESVDLSTWKFFEGDTNHGITAVGATTVESGGYAVIADNPAKFQADWPSYSGLIFDSAFSLNNTGETLTLRCCGKELSDRDSVTYNATGGGAGDGLTLHRSGSSLVSGSPSPGSSTISSPPPPAPEPEEKEEPIQEVRQEQKQEQKVAEETKSVSVMQVEEPEVTAAPATVIVQEEKSVPAKKTSRVVARSDESEETREVEDRVEEPVVQSSLAAAAEAAPAQEHSSWLWWGGAAVLSLVGAFGAYVAGRRQSAGKKWEIEEIE